MKLSFKDLASIFSLGHRFGEEAGENVEELQRMLDDEEIQVEAEKLPQVPDERWTGTWALIRIGPYFSGPMKIGIFTGSGPHQVVCARAALWLEQRGMNWSDSALDYAGGAADVASEDQTVFVEAGYTQARKVVRAARAGISVLVAPYGEPLIGYFFRPTEKCKHVRPGDGSGMYLPLVK